MTLTRALSKVVGYYYVPGKRMPHKFYRESFFYAQNKVTHYRLGPFARHVFSSPPVLPLRVQTACCQRYYRPADFPNVSSALTRLIHRALKRSAPFIPCFDCCRSPLANLPRSDLTTRILPDPTRSSHTRRHMLSPGFSNMCSGKPFNVDSSPDHGSLLRSPAPCKVTTSPNFTHRAVNPLAGRRIRHATNSGCCHR